SRIEPVKTAVRLLFELCQRRVCSCVSDEGQPDREFATTVGIQRQKVKQDVSRPFLHLTPSWSSPQAGFDRRCRLLHGIADHLGTSRKVMLNTASADSSFCGD